MLAYHHLYTVVDDPFCTRRSRELLEEGKSVQLKGDVDRALELYTRSIRVLPTAEALTHRAWAYRAKNRLEDAIAECKRAIELDPQYGNPYNDIGSYLLSQGKLDEAIEWFENAKKAQRYDARHFPFMNLGRVYAAKGMTLRAIQEFEAALQISPGDATCLAAIAYLRDVSRPRPASVEMLG
jgi:tetratricopeptide (TPR) repeat protein